MSYFQLTEEQAQRLDDLHYGGRTTESEEQEYRELLERAEVAELYTK